ncbi:MAG: hypothetical protein BJ554DRAFT_1691 [Olpidium bornovanus]|uniref:Uncharacterized protein n=1 Tax=Olpidium bornovanus TaxID=278681 RepID=A0A8H7ZS08_9FUNG|nr:MAG: hypothetical protein BJ554DRAFT_1691 [Olpidium bornovanus]
MRKEDYQEQVRQAKALFEREMRDRGVKQTAASAVANDSADHRSSSSRAAAAQVPSLDVDERPVERVRSEMFDVFHDVISSGKHTDVSVTQAVLTEEYGLREEEITQLIKYGLLTTEPTENVLKFSARGAGAFVTNLTRGRTDLCRFLKRAKYMEMLESVIKRKKFRFFPGGG